MVINVSVIIPVYNAKNTISEAIDSILNQTHQNFEIVIIDDGSTDNTESILKKYMNKEEKIKVYTQVNQGVSKARNNGIKKATGKYITFLDADDLYHPTFLEKMYNRIKKNESDICYCGVDTIPEGRKLKWLDKFRDGDILVDYVKGKIPLHTGTWLINKEYLETNELFFPEGVSWGEDLEFFYKAVALTDKITFVPEYLTYYRNNHSEQQLSSFSLELIDQDYKFIQRIINDPKINKNKKVERVLLEYRLPALITHKLWTAIQEDYEITDIKQYYKKYQKYLEQYKWNNGLRSLNINIKKWRLKRFWDKKKR